MRYRGSAIGVLLAILLHPALGQQKDSIRQGAFVGRDFGRFLVSDLYSPVTKLQLGVCPNGADYNNDPLRTANNIMVEEFTLGTDLPLYTGTFTLARHQYQFSIATSLSAVIWFDLLNKKSSPILNVDYRLGLPEIYIRRELDHGFFRNIVLRAALLQHESTHIGDELTLYRKEAGFPITRINVSYESGEASLTVNSPDGPTNNNHGITLGSKLLYKNEEHDGFYTMQAWEGDLSRFVPSTRRLEGYLRYQYDGPRGPLRVGRFYPVFSAELRQRVKYGYSYFVTDPDAPNGFREVTEPEKYSPSLNIYAGWREKDQTGHPGHIGAYLRFYNGINPHGQFRNIPSYTFIGFAVVYEN